MASGKWDVLNDRPSLDGFCYPQGVLAGSLGSGNCVHLKSLVSGKSATLPMPDGHQITKVALSASAVGVTTSLGVCHIWSMTGAIENVQETDQQSFELTDIPVQALVLSGKALVVLYDSDLQSLGQADVRTWDLESCSAYHLSFPSHRSSSTAPKDKSYSIIIITRGGNSIVFFERFSVESCSQGAHFIRLSLDGQVESTGFIEHPDVGHYTWHSEGSLTPQIEGSVTLVLCTNWAAS